MMGKNEGKWRDDGERKKGKRESGGRQAHKEALVMLLRPKKRTKKREQRREGTVREAVIRNRNSNIQQTHTHTTDT